MSRLLEIEKKSRAAARKNKSQLLQKKTFLIRKVFFVLLLVVGGGAGTNFLLNYNFSFAVDLSDIKWSPSLMHTESVGIAGDLQYVLKDEIQEAVNPFVEQAFWLLDLEKIKASVEQIAWVDSVTVKRKFPASLLLTIVEQKPIARWKDKGLLNYRGESFIVRQGEGNEQFNHLPLLDGSTLVLPNLMKQFISLKSLLVSGGVDLIALSVDDRNSWSMRLNGGMSVILGKNELLHSAHRFLKIYNSGLLQEQSTLTAFDMRHSRGMAVI